MGTVPARATVVFRPSSALNRNFAMPGKLVVGVVGDLCREDEGEYTCQMCTVFGLDKEEVKTLCGVGLKFKDENKEAEGYEVKTSAFKVMRELGRHLGYEPKGDCQVTEAPGDRRTLIWTLVKEC